LSRVISIGKGNVEGSGEQQPWNFAAVGNPEIKGKIRLEAEKVESGFYHRRAPQSWLEDLLPFATDEHKPCLERAPWLIVIFEQKYSTGEQGEINKHDYTREAVGLATGMLITTVHQAGLASLTTPPARWSFLTKGWGDPLMNAPS
jgi:hypothetical protein